MVHITDAEGVCPLRCSHDSAAPRSRGPARPISRAGTAQDRSRPGSVRRSRRPRDRVGLAADSCPALTGGDAPASGAAPGPAGRRRRIPLRRVAGRTSGPWAGSRTSTSASPTSAWTSAGTGSAVRCPARRRRRDASAARAARLQRPGVHTRPVEARRPRPRRAQHDAPVGAEREGLLRRHLKRPDGTWRDTVLYALLAPSRSTPAARGPGPGTPAIAPAPRSWPAAGSLPGGRPRIELPPAGYR